MTDSSSVLAIIVTFNAPESLTRCIDALLDQTRPPDEVLIIDNHSEPATLLAPSRPSNVGVLRLDRNEGPAGGYYEGLKRFIDSAHDAAWLVEDDVEAESGCLEALLRERDKHVPARVIKPVVKDSSREGESYGWHGVMLPREVVQRIGLPRREFFWWMEDTEYLQLRLWKTGTEWVLTPDAKVVHNRVRRTDSRPPWKYYYETRNSIFCWLYVSPVNRKSRARKLVRLIGRFTYSILLKEEERQLEKGAMFVRGIVDGFTRRLGSERVRP